MVSGRQLAGASAAACCYRVGLWTRPYPRGRRLDLETPGVLAYPISPPPPVIAAVCSARAIYRRARSNTRFTDCVTHGCKSTTAGSRGAGRGSQAVVLGLLRCPWKAILLLLLREGTRTRKSCFAGRTMPLAYNSPGV
jgi:hypothetical protein